VRPEKRVYNYLLRIVANREGALADPARFAPWLYRIAHNEAYSLFRKRRPEGETEELQPETLEGAATFGGNAVFPVELTLAVSGALRKLSADRQPDDSLISYARGRGRGRGIDESRYVAPTGKPDSRKRSDCRARYLEYLATSQVYRAALAAAPDDEPVTEGDAQAIERTAVEIRAGKVVEHQEILREFGIE